MPAGATFRCSSCGESRSFHPLIEYRNDSGSLVPVPHPCEASTLEKLGTDFKRAKAQRRLFMSEDWACRECGHVLPHRYVMLPHLDPGCLVWSILVFAVPLLILASPAFASAIPGLDVAVQTVGVFGLFVGWLIGVFAFSCTIDLLNRIRFRNEWESNRPERCSSCGSRRMFRPSTVTVQSTKRPRRNNQLTCDTCGKRQLVAVESWIS